MISKIAKMMSRIRGMQIKYTENKFRFHFFTCSIWILILLSGCSTVRTAHTSKPETKESLDLFLLIGQSNMAGRAAITSKKGDTLKNVYLFTGDSWQPAANPFNKYSTIRKSLSMQKLGPGYSFAKELSACTGRKIGLVVSARGGTALEWWEKGYTGSHDYNMYEETIKLARKAQKDGHLKGILWLQGSANKRRPESYMSLLKELVKDLQADLGTKSYFVGGEIGKWRQSSVKINQVIRTIPEEIKNAGYVSADGLTPLKGDTTNPHFDTRSQLLLGKRYADEILKNVYGIKSCNDSSIKDTKNQTSRSKTRRRSSLGKKPFSAKSKIYSIQKYFDKKSETYYYLTRIKHTDADGKLIKLRLAHTIKKDGETVREFALRTNSELAFNASTQVKFKNDKERADMPSAVAIVEGDIIDNSPRDRRYTLGIKDNNELKVYKPGTTTQEILNDGVENAVTAFIPLILNHKPVSDDILNDVGNSDDKHPRQVIAQFDNLDILFLTTGGRGYGGKGMTAKDLIRILRGLDVKFAYNLDGGGSTSTVVKGKFINWKMDKHGTKERTRPTFLYVK